jgi:hypothetical protein
VSVANAAADGRRRMHGRTRTRVMSDYRTKKIALPSGQMIEIIYLIDPDAPADPTPQTPVGGAHDTDLPLHYCPACTSDLVYPVAWQETGEGVWTVERRCPNCEWHDVGVFEQADIEPFDDAIEIGTEILLTELRTWTYSNMNDDVELLIHALDQDLIQPIDF